MHVRVRRAAVAAAALALGATTLVTVPGVASAVVTLPAPEVDGGAFSVSDDEVAYALEWEAPEPTHQAGTTLTGYEAVLYTGAPSFSTVVAQSTTTATGRGVFYFDGLNVAQKYQGVLRAVYSIDQDPDPDTVEYSAWSNAPVASALRPAPRVLSLKAKASGAGALKVTWVRPSVGVNQEAIGGYSVDASPSLDFDDFMNPDFQYESTGKSVDPSRTSTTLRGLKPGKTYDIAVLTYGATGEDFGGGFGGYASTSAKVIGAPGKATGLTATTLAGGKTRFGWKGVKSTSAHPVSGYQVYVNGKLKKTVGKAARSYVAKGQKAGKRYTYTVRAVNSVALGAKASLTKRR